MSKIKKLDKLSKKYDGQYDDLGEPTRKKHIKSKFKKKLPKWAKKFNKQSDYRKRAKGKNKK
jgi:hypothetical protein|tara:strand:+ start:67 stop:252 length:186 start_codon:yes stop_codon:yes gene_type:complete